MRITSYLPILLLASILMLNGVQLIQLKSAVHESTVLKEDEAQLNMIRYGILSVNSWKEKVAAVLGKKIKELELDEKNRPQIKKTIESALNRLLDEVKEVMDDQRSQGNLWSRLKGEAVGIFFDIEDFRDDIPRFAEAVLDELEKPGAKESITTFIEKKLDEFVLNTVGYEDTTARDEIMARYDATGAQSVSEEILKQESIVSARIWRHGLILIVCTILAFMLMLFSKTEDRISFLLLLALTLLPLYLGVTTPMIDIDARIETFRFELMGEEIRFDDQVLYFQSKSIWDVVRILTQNGGMDTLIVGILVMGFSIIFPLLKLISLIGIEFKRPLMRHRLISFFAFRSSKWSMADVLVVSIFMTYIGFKGVIDSQLGQMERQEGNLDVLTTDNTSLQVGFSLFLLFTLCGMVMSEISKRRFTA